MGISLVSLSPSQRLIKAGAHHNAPVGARIAGGEQPARGWGKVEDEFMADAYPSRFLPEPMPLVALSP